MLKTGDLVEISPWKVFWSILDENFVFDGMRGERGDAGFNVGPTTNYFGVIVSIQKRYVIANTAMKPKYEYAYYVLLHDCRRGWASSAGLRLLNAT